MSDNPAEGPITKTADRQSPPANVETVLVLHLSRIGDLIQALPFFTALRRQFPQARIDCVVVDACVEVLRGAPVDTIWPLPARHLPRLNAEIEALPQAGRAPLCEQVLAALPLPSAGRVYNLSHAPLAGWLAARLSTQLPSHHGRGLLIDAAGRRRFSHPWDCYLYAEPHTRPANQFNLVDLWRGLLDGVSPDCDWNGPRLALDSDPVPGLPRHPCVALNPGGNEAWRRWPMESFADLARELRRRGIAPVLVGSPADQPLCERLAICAGFALPSFAGRTSLARMARLLHDVDLLVTNDTGAVHIAAAVGTRVVGLYGDISYFPLTAPWGEGHLLLHRSSAAAEQPAAIPVAAVVAAVLHQLHWPDAPHLGQALAGAGVEAWQTRFLPPQADSLGGLTCLPLVAAPQPPEALFRRAVRHALADLGRGAKPAHPAAAPYCADGDELGAAVAAYYTALRQLAAAASAAAQAIAQGQVSAAARLDDLHHQMERLAAPGDAFPSLRLLLLHLSVWLQSLDDQPPLARLQSMQAAFLRAAAILDRASCGHRP